MKSKISALVDGELGRAEAEQAFAALSSEDSVRDTWRAYHLISDSMRDTHWLSAGFAQRVAARLAQEPTVLAPSRRRRLPIRVPFWALSAAASLAAVAMVGWVAFGPQEIPGAASVQVAQSPRQHQPALDAIQVVAPPDAANDYLLAHQGYSPRNSLQGIAPYVRTVSSSARASGR